VIVRLERRGVVKDKSWLLEGSRKTKGGTWREGVGMKEKKTLVIWKETGKNVSALGDQFLRTRALRIGLSDQRDTEKKRLMPGGWLEGNGNL